MIPQLPANITKIIGVLGIIIGYLAEPAQLALFPKPWPTVIVVIAGIIAALGYNQGDKDAAVSGPTTSTTNPTAK